jgi:hypothetical protein
VVEAGGPSGEDIRRLWDMVRDFLVEGGGPSRGTATGGTSTGDDPPVRKRGVALA